MNPFRYCPSCRKLLKSVEERLLDCTCGFHFYLNPAPCSLAVLTNTKKQILFVVRGGAPRKGYLDFPGGFIEYNESIETGIRRELQEEIGVVPRILTYFTSYPDRYLYKGIQYNVVSSAFSGTLSTREVNKVRAADDISGYEWHHRTKLPIARFAFPSMKKILEDFLSTRG